MPAAAAKPAAATEPAAAAEPAETLPPQVHSVGIVTCRGGGGGGAESTDQVGFR